MSARQFSGRQVRMAAVIAGLFVLLRCAIGLAQNGPPPLVSSKEFGLRAVSPRGEAIHIDDVRAIVVFINGNDMWSDGPKPEILRRFPGEWVAVDKEMFALGNGGALVRVTITSQGVAMLAGGKFPDNGAQTLELKAFGNPHEIGADISAGPSPVAAGDIAGQVVDPQGKPVAGAVVSFPRPVQFARIPNTTPVTTGADGVFRFARSDLRGGAYLQVEKTGYGPRWIENAPRGKGFIVHLDDQTRLKGKLTLPDGSPAANAKIELMDYKAYPQAGDEEGTVEIPWSAATNAAGEYDLQLEPGEYDVQISTAGGFVARYLHFPVYSGQTAALSPELKPGVKLAICAINTVTAQPVAGVHFYMQKFTPGYVFPIEGTDRATDAQGMAQWDGLMPGPARIGVIAKGYGRWWMMKPGEVRQDNERALNEIFATLEVGMPQMMVAMEPAMHVSGRVLSPSGQPVSGAVVDVGRLWTGDSRYHATTDAQGNYSLIFAAVSDNWGMTGRAEKFAIVACDPHRRWANGISEDFQPKAGAEMSVDVHMTAGGHMHGKIVDGAGKAVVGIEVLGIATDWIDHSYYSPRALTDAQGNYVLGPMRAASYEVHPNIHFGSGIRTITTGGKTQTDVTDNAPVVAIKEGETLDVKPITYDGPPPGQLPEYYNRMYPWGVAK